MILASLNFIVDPFVHIFLRKSYRQAVWRTVFCCRCSQRATTLTESSTVQYNWFRHVSSTHVILLSTTCILSSSGWWYEKPTCYQKPKLRLSSAVPVRMSCKSEKQMRMQTQIHLYQRHTPLCLAVLSEYMYLPIFTIVYSKWKRFWRSNKDWNSRQLFTFIVWLIQFISCLRNFLSKLTKMPWRKSCLQAKTKLYNTL